MYFKAGKADVYLQCNRKQGRVIGQGKETAVIF